MLQSGTEWESVTTPTTEEPGKYDSLEPLERLQEFCTYPECGAEIRTMSYKGTGACGEVHRKLLNGEDHGKMKALSP
jgi:hypothetical protein